MDSSPVIVISGLPGAGKSTVARQLTARLGLPLVEKDVVLEALFDSMGVGDGDWRTRLSRAADEVLFTTARTLPRVVLDNWWHHDRHPERLLALGRPVVEIHCACDPATAVERFRRRRRHPGHLDGEWTDDRARAWVARAETVYPGPLRLGGPLITVDTGGSVDVGDLCDQVIRTCADVMAVGTEKRGS